jgi:transposase
VCGLKHQKEKRSKHHFADRTRRLRRPASALWMIPARSFGSEGGERARSSVGGVGEPAYHFKRIGLEAGPLSQRLFSALAEDDLPVICVETRHMRAVLKAQVNKTDRIDARGIAQMMRVGLYRPVHVKTLRSRKLRMLLTHRKLLQSKAIAVDNDLRGTLRNFGLKVRGWSRTALPALMRRAVERSSTKLNVRPSRSTSETSAESSPSAESSSTETSSAAAESSSAKSSWVARRY